MPPVEIAALLAQARALVAAAGAEKDVDSLRRRLAETERSLGQITAIFSALLSRQLPTLESAIREVEEHSLTLSEARPLGWPVLPREEPLTWSVLPRDHWMRERSRGRASVRWVTTEELERIDLLLALRPAQLYEGKHLGQHRYYVADFGHVAIADAGRYGNALFFVRKGQGDWRTVLRVNKREAQKAGAGRIRHIEGWEEKVRALVATTPE